MKQTVQSHQEKLVEALSTQGITSPAILEAFAQVPRHCFVHDYYERQTGENTWVRKTPTDESEEWYQQIYSDRAFVTLVDAVGRTLSSSSQPSIMAQMLTALNVQAGHRVLEIGTGTGYNAAILASLTGDSALVTTIEIDSQTAESAQEALRSTGYSAVNVVRADGREGYASAAPYDSIIATASTPTIPSSWKEQLSEGGTLVAVLQPGIAMEGGVLQAVKQNNRLFGKLLYKASFMPLHDVQFKQLPGRLPHIDLSIPVIESFSLTPRLFDPEMIWTPGFQFFLYATSPKLHIVEIMEQQEEPSDLISTWFFDEEEPEHSVSFSQEEDRYKVELRGEKARVLWMQLIRASTLWQSLEKPVITEYQFEMDQEGQRCFLQGDSGKIWPFLV